MSSTTMPEDAQRTHSHGRVLWILCAGIALALAGNVYQWVRADRQSRDLAVLEQNTERQMAKLTDAASTEAQLNQQRFDSMQSALKADLEGATAAALKQARADVKRSSTQLAQNLEERRQEFEQKNQEVATQLADLKQDTSSKIQDASTKLQDTSTKLDQVSTTVDQHGSDLKRVVGDMGVMSGDIATNGKELAMLKELGSRDYFEFDISKTKEPQKVGDIRLLLRKTDPKHNRFTVSVYADDKIVDKRDRTINEPVQLYVAGNRQPYEIVVNQVKNNEVVGYLATPKVKAPRAQTTASKSF